jgi:hypothetical protein
VSDLGQRYFYWLYDQIFEIRDPDSPLSYLSLCDVIHQHVFLVAIPQDLNRAADGSELRNEFIREMGIGGPQAWSEILNDDASIFEVLIGLAKRADFMVDRTVGWWFMQFIINLGFAHYNDKQITPNDSWRISRSLRRFNDRTYRPTGRGGIFPLRIPNTDQRQVELWYQMAAYMTENVMY